MTTKHFVGVGLTALLLTLIFTVNLTKAVFFDDYLSHDDIVLGKEDRAYYLVLINESAKGNLALGSPFLKEWSREMYLYPALNVHLLGFLQNFLNLEAKNMAILLDYGAVFIVMVLIIILFLVIFRFHYFGYLAAIFYAFLPRMLVWDRTISPQTNFIPLLVFLIVYFLRLSGRTRALALGFLVGALFYVYPYYWTFALVLVVLEDLWDWGAARKIVLDAGYKYLVIAAMLPFYLLHMWHAHQLSYYGESLRRIGALYSRLPAGFYTQALIIFLGIFYLLFRKLVLSRLGTAEGIPNLQKVFLGLAAALVVLNQQLLTGMQLEFNSHYMAVIIIFLVAFMSGFIFMLTRLFPAQRKALFLVCSLAAGLFLLNAFRTQTANDPYVRGENYSPPAEMEVFQWFRENDIQNATIYAPPEIGNKLLLLTDNYLFFHGGQELHLIPTAELIDRFTYFDIANNVFTQNLLQYQQAIFGQTFNSKREKDNVLGYAKAMFTRRPFYPKILDTYLNFDFEPIKERRLSVNPQALDERLDAYNVSYLVYRRAEENTIYKYISGKIVYENNLYLIKIRSAEFRVF